jgi:hypothetical protein
VNTVMKLRVLKMWRISLLTEGLLASRELFFTIVSVTVSVFMQLTHSVQKPISTSKKQDVGYKAVSARDTSCLSKMTPYGVARKGLILLKE